MVGVGVEVGVGVRAVRSVGGMPRGQVVRVGRVDAVLEPQVSAPKQVEGDLVLVVVVVVPQLVEQGVDPPMGLAAEQVGQLAGLRRDLGTFLPPDGVGPNDRARHGEELGTDVDDPGEQATLLAPDGPDSGP